MHTDSVPYNFMHFKFKTANVNALARERIHATAFRNNTIRILIVRTCANEEFLEEKNFRNEKNQLQKLMELKCDCSKFSIIKQ